MANVRSTKYCGGEPWVGVIAAGLALKLSGANCQTSYLRVLFIKVKDFQLRGDLHTELLVELYTTSH